MPRATGALALSRKMKEFGWFGVVRGHSRSSAMSPFDRSHTTPYSTLIETTCILVPFTRYSEIFVKSRQFYLPHLLLSIDGTETDGRADVRGYIDSAMHTLRVMNGY